MGESLMRPITELRAAVGFLTRIPVGRIDGYDVALARSTAYFPAVGAIVAAVGLGAWWVGATLLGPLAGAVLGVLATVVVTGALHEDGLADTVDGFWGGATREQRLAVMRDSRLGTYGAIAVAGDILLRVALLAPYGSDDWLDVGRVLLAGHVLGRAAPIALAATLPPARAGGLGTRLTRPRRSELAIASVLVAAVAIGTVGPWAPVPIVAGGLAWVILGRAARRRIGGVTGDVYGAGVLLTNLAVAASIVALEREELGWDV
jgi:adenosylcobinamide-GDP ribazoletransferase